jgi:hypothetical protein
MQVAECFHILNALQVYVISSPGILANGAADMAFRDTAEFCCYQEMKVKIMYIILFLIQSFKTNSKPDMQMFCAGHPTTP